MLLARKFLISCLQGRINKEMCDFLERDGIPLVVIILELQLKMQVKCFADQLLPKQDMTLQLAVMFLNPLTVEFLMTIGKQSF